MGLGTSVLQQQLQAKDVIKATAKQLTYMLTYSNLVQQGCLQHALTSVFTHLKCITNALPLSQIVTRCNFMLVTHRLALLSLRHSCSAVCLECRSSSSHLRGKDSC